LAIQVIRTWLKRLTQRMTSLLMIESTLRTWGCHPFL